MNEFDPTKYSITIRTKTVEGHTYFVGTVNELPDVEVFEDSYGDAYTNVINIISALKQTADKRGRLFPVPAPMEEEYSGRITLRLSKSMHKKVAVLAQIDGVSLNQFIVSSVSETVGQKFVEQWANIQKASTPNQYIGAAVGHIISTSLVALSGALSAASHKALYAPYNANRAVSDVAVFEAVSQGISQFYNLANESPHKTTVNPLPVSINWQ